jgi:chromosome segregation ATPase
LIPQTIRWQTLDADIQTGSIAMNEFLSEIRKLFTDYNGNIQKLHKAQMDNMEQTYQANDLLKQQGHLLRAEIDQEKKEKERLQTELGQQKAEKERLQAGFDRVKAKKGRLQNEIRSIES